MAFMFGVMGVTSVLAIPVAIIIFTWLHFAEKRRMRRADRESDVRLALDKLIWESDLKGTD